MSSRLARAMFLHSATRSREILLLWAASESCDSFPESRDFVQ